MGKDDEVCELNLALQLQQQSLQILCMIFQAFCHLTHHFYSGLL